MRMSKKLLGTIKNATNALTDLIQEYSAIGTPDECRAAMEKQKAKKPKERDCIGFNTLVCPVCKEALCLYEPYCDNCGQAIDWSDED